MKSPIVNSSSLLAICVAGAGLLAACGDDSTGSTMALPPPTSATTTPANPTGNAPAAPASPVWTPPNSAVPAAGPGSAASSARQFFIDTVYPAISNCGACHGNGAGGAPIWLPPDKGTSYQTLDARAYIVKNSPLLSKGAHMGPALTTEQMNVLNQWLDMEAKERVGQAAPVNILEKIGSCLQQPLFDAIGFQNLVTQPRANEDANQCTGCNNVQCNTCHTAGDAGFYMGVGSTIDPFTFAKTKTAKYIVHYIGLNGVQPVPSQRIKAKAALVATAPAYSHPMFVVAPEMELAINNFVNAAISNYNAKLCGQ